MSDVSSPFTTAVSDLAGSLRDAIIASGERASASEDLPPDGIRTSPSQMPGSRQDDYKGGYIAPLTVTGIGGGTLLLLGLALYIIYRGK